MEKKIFKLFVAVIFSSLGLCAVTNTASALTMNSYDLTARGVSVTIAGTGAIATEFTEAMQTFVSSGTGVISPFLTVNAKGTESGVNTDGTPLPFDDQRPQWNNAITLADLQNADYTFALDIDEPKAEDKAVLTLTEFKIWTLPNAAGGSLVTKNNTPDYDSLVRLLSSEGGEMVFDLDVPDAFDNNILLHYDLWNGSGQNLDMLLEVPEANFSDSDSMDFLYVWTQFTGSDNGGFEEWILIPSASPVPEPSTIILLGFGLIGLASCRFKSRKG